MSVNVEIMDISSDEHNAGYDSHGDDSVDESSNDEEHNAGYDSHGDGSGVDSSSDEEKNAGYDSHDDGSANESSSDDKIYYRSLFDHEYEAELTYKYTRIVAHKGNVIFGS